MAEPTNKHGVVSGEIGGPSPVSPGDPPPAASGEDWGARVDELLVEAEAAPDVTARVAVLCRVAEIYERRLGDPQGALVTLQAALEQDPSSGRVVQEMERVARSHGYWAQMVAATAEVADGLARRAMEALPPEPITGGSEPSEGSEVNDAKQAADLWVQIAFWNESGLGMLDEAARAAGRALELAPEHGGALTLLEDLYRRQRAWDGYVAILARKRESPGYDPYKLADAYREVVHYEPRHPGALEGLATVHEETGEWAAAADAWQKLIAASAVGDERLLPARHRLAAILKDRLADTRGAEEQLVEALALPGGGGHIPSLLALHDIYRDRTDWLKARQLLGRAAAVTQDANERVRFLVEAAEICADELDDENQAAQLYDEAIAIDPTRIDVVGRLAAIRHRRGDWRGLLPLAEFLVAKSEGSETGPAAPGPERAQLWYMLARSLEETGDVARATDAYRAALAADPASDAALGPWRDLAALFFRLEQWPEAVEAYSALLEAHAPLLRRGESVDAWERLGVARLRAGDAAQALPALEKALALEPRRRGVLEALLEAAKAAGDDDAIVRHTQSLLAITEDREAKRELLETVAAIHHDRRHDPQRAIAAYRAALQDWPDERSIMHRLLELLTETKQWKQAVAMLLRLAELAEPENRAPYFVAAGNILADEINALPEAIDAYEQALDADPNDLRTFERIDRLVTGTRDWKVQARSYRRQIKRMGSDVPPERRPALLALWQGLGEIYRTRLKDYPSAIAAFEVAAGLDPDSIERRNILAELYRLAGSETYPKAVAELRAIVQRVRTVAGMVPSLKIMVRLFVEMGALDEAYSVAAVLTLAGQADVDEHALYEQYRPRGVVRAHGRLGEDMWQRLLYHPDEDRVLSQLLATLSPTIGLVRAKAPRDVGLKRKQQRDINSDPSVVCKAFAYASQVFGVPPPEIYFAEDSPGEVEVANIRGTMSGMPALVIGRRLLEMSSDLEVAFTVGRTLAAVRPDHLLRWPTFVPTLEELEIAVRAAVVLVDSDRPPPAEVATEVERYRRFLEGRLPPQSREQLSVLVRRFGAAHAADDGALRAELGRWARGACLTTIRAGFLLSGDLEVSARLGEAVAAAGGIDVAEVVRDLCTFGVSEAYFELRAALGLRNVNIGFRG